VVLNVSASPAGPISANFNPYSETAAFNFLGATSMIYEPLLQFNSLKDGVVHPWLATSYAWSNNGQTVTFQIRNGVQWSDGKPFSAADVAFTLNLLKDNPSLNLAGVRFATATASGSTVTVTFTSPGYTLFFNIANSYIVPQHIWSTAGNPATFTNTNPVGTGPYLLKGSSVQRISLVKNPRYWQPGLPKVAGLNYVTFDSNTSANLALEQGQLDWAGNFVPAIRSLYVAKDPTHNHYWFPPLRTYGLVLNITQPPFENVLVRQAISDALDRQQIVATGEQNEQPPAVSPTGLALPTQAQYLAPQYQNLRYSQNVEQAKTLLARAGYHLSNGAMVNAGGQPLAFSMLIPGSFTDSITDLQVVAQQLGAIGIKASIDSASISTWAVDLFTGKFQATIGNGALVSSTDPSPFPWYNLGLNYALSAPIGTIASADQERWNDPATNALLAEYANAQTDAQRQSALNSLQAIQVTQSPTVPFAEGVAWSEYSSAKVTGWPSASNPYTVASPIGPSAEYVLLHLTPVGGS
jgi:peptide/nickel transport system substrate-binding protein